MLTNTLRQQTVRRMTREQKAAMIAADIAASRQATEAHLAAFRARQEKTAAMRAAGTSEADIWKETDSWYDPRTPAERERDAAAEDWQQQVRDLRASL
jgi:hypothetical protein